MFDVYCSVKPKLLDAMCKTQTWSSWILPEKQFDRVSVAVCKDLNFNLFLSLVLVILWKNNCNTRSIQRTQTPPGLVTFDLDLLSSPLGKVKKASVIRCRLLYCTLVQGMMSVSVIVCEIWPLLHFWLPLTFAYDLHRPSNSLSFLSLDGRYVVVYWFQLRSL